MFKSIFTSSFLGNFIETCPALVRGDAAVLRGFAGGQRLLQLQNQLARRRGERHLGSQRHQASSEVRFLVDVVFSEMLKM